jgi:diguanylate cyclase
VLRVVARVLSNSVRAEDLVARYGGEEFVVVFDGLPAETAQHRAGILRRRIEQIEFNVGQEVVPVTMSVGLTGLIASDTMETAFERADQALYRAKRSGRNRCCYM